MIQIRKQLMSIRIANPVANESFQEHNKMPKHHNSLEMRTQNAS